MAPRKGVAVSNAERQRLYRLRRDADPGRRETYLKDKNRKYKSDIHTGTRKTIADMAPRDQRSQRKQWRERQNNCRRASNQMTTPPPSPDGDIGQRARGRKRVALNRAKCYRKVRKLESDIEDEKRKTDRYRKRYERLVKRHVRASQPTFHFALIADMKQRFSESKAERERQVFCRFVSGKIIKKYRLRKYATQQLSLSQRRWYADDGFVYRHARPTKPVHNDVEAFYARDDNSRMTTGVKNTITRLKMKKQRRLLTETMKNLHRKFSAESSFTISYTVFCRLRPFWVVEPTNLDRQTCMCKKHEHFQFMADKLRELHLISSSDIEELVKRVVCNPDSKECAYGTCNACNKNSVPWQMPLQGRSNEDVRFPQWVLKKVQRTDKACPSSATGEVTITAKEVITSTIRELMDKFTNDIHQVKKHVFVIRHQFRVYRTLRETMPPESCMIHVDFSENFVGKYATEIQAVHFGGSQQQMTLHTGVLYLKNQTIPFCTISPSTQHDPPAIWAHLTPILQMIRLHPDVKTLHVFTDGPTTQYRQKGNFYSMSTRPFDFGFHTISWHFFESGHGKGAPDGIGGALKRTADRQVKLGKDIPNAKVLYDVLQETTSIQLFYIRTEEIAKITSEMSALKLATVKGTMRLHQVISTRKGEVKYRDVSCVCSLPGIHDCPCFDLKVFQYQLPAPSSASTSPDATRDPMTTITATSPDATRDPMTTITATSPDATRDPMTTITATSPDATRDPMTTITATSPDATRDPMTTITGDVTRCHS